MRQKVLLGILAALVLIVAWVYLVPGDDAAPPPAIDRAAGRVDGDVGLAVPVRAAAADRGAAAAAAVSSSGAGAKDAQTVLALRIEDLSRVPASFTTGRDPWRFVEPPPPPPPTPKRPSAAELRAMQEAEEARQRMLAEQEAARLAEAAKPHPPPFTWIYLGNFGPARQRIAVFTDGKRVWNAREGDTLEDKFVVAQIGYESVDIRFVGFPTVPPERLAVKH
jgi:hypothetical protein